MKNKKWNWLSFLGILVFLVNLFSCAGENVSTSVVPITSDKKPATKVDIVYDKTTLKVGETLKLSANVTPSDSTDSVEWLSSNDGFAVVDSTGVVYAVYPGVVIITAKAGKVSASVTITVESQVPPTIPATKVEIISDTTTVKVGEKLNLYTRVSPSDSTDSVTWSSSNLGIATVNSYGVVTAKSAGTVIITAKAGNISTSVTITVTEIPATKVDLLYDATTLKVGKYVNIRAIITPSNTTDSVTWSSSNSGVAEVNSSGFVIAKSAGTAIITAKAGNVSASVTITVEPQEPPTISATKVEINEADSIDIIIDDTKRLSANVTPANTTDTVFWKSSNPEIVRISSPDNYDGSGTTNAVIEGLAKGYSVITVTAGDVTDSITINVVEPPKVSYKVLYYTQKLNDESKYDLAGTESGYGEKDSQISVEDYIKEYTGFNFNKTKSDSTISLSKDNLELKLYYDRESYTITFDTDGGSEINSISGKYESTVKAPANPTKKHFTFDGWSPELPSTFTKNLTVKAKWKEDEKGQVELIIY